MITISNNLFKLYPHHQSQPIFFYIDDIINIQTTAISIDAVLTDIGSEENYHTLNIKDTLIPNRTYTYFISKQDYYTLLDFLPYTIILFKKSISNTQLNTLSNHTRPKLILQRIP